jgi:hypothetical protein
VKHQFPAQQGTLGRKPWGQISPTKARKGSPILVALKPVRFGRHALKGSPPIGLARLPTSPQSPRGTLIDLDESFVTRSGPLKRSDEQFSSSCSGRLRQVILRVEEMIQRKDNRAGIMKHRHCQVRQQRVVDLVNRGGRTSIRFFGKR